MAKNEQTSFLDEAFDDKKAAEEMERIKGSNRLGCIFMVLIVVVIAVVIICGAGIVGSLGSL